MKISRVCIFAYVDSDLNYLHAIERIEKKQNLLQAYRCLAGLVDTKSHTYYLLGGAD